MNVFFCKACLIDKPLSEKSSDPRYCLGCFDFLKEEAKVNGSTARWVPRPVTDNPVKPQQPLPGLNQQAQNVVQKFSRRGRPSLFLDSKALGVISDTSRKTRQVADLLGISKSTVASLRKKIQGG